MSETMKQTQAAAPFWVGVDWGEFKHAVSVVDAQRSLAAQFVVETTPAGLAELKRRLAGFAEIGGVAIESTANLVVPFLLSQGHTLYMVNPKLSKSWRDSNSVAGVKSDARDGEALALELSRRHESLRPVRRCAPEAAELEALCEASRNCIAGRTALLQRLRTQLRLFYPAATEFFTDLGAPAAWRFLKRFPTPGVLARARKKTLYKFLRSNRIGISSRWQERVENAANAQAHPCSPVERVHAMEVQSIVAQLRELQRHIDKFDKVIAERVETLPQARLVQSLPGAGDRLAPALTAIAAVADEEENPLQAMRCLSGVAPVERSSGMRCRAQFRVRCNKHWRNVLHLYARISIVQCTWAKAFYKLCRQRGDGYAAALRKLADKWLKIIHRMIKTNECYDEERYVEALRKSQSPVYKKLCEITAA